MPTALLVEEAPPELVERGGHTTKRRVHPLQDPARQREARSSQ